MDLSVTTRSRIMTEFSAERFRRFVLTAHIHRIDPLDLYRWNAEVSGAFMVLIAHAEVLMRNAVARQFGQWSEERGFDPWYDNRHGMLHQRSVETITDVKMRLEARKVSITPSAVVAELNLGFWRSLVTKRYRTTLWPRVLSPVFLADVDDKFRTVSRAVADMHMLRNRIAHHEHLLSRGLDDDRSKLLFLIRSVAPAGTLWVEASDTVARRIADDPRRNNWT